MSYESALARVNQLHGTVLAHEAAPVPAGPAGAAQTTAFAQQLQLALQQQALQQDPAAGGDPTAGGQAGAFPAAQGGASPYGAMPYGGASPYGMQPAGAATPYGASPYGMPQLLLPPGAAAPAGGVQPAAGGSFPMVSGDVKGLNPDLLARLNQVGVQLGTKVHVESGFRSRAEQERLYQMYLNGTGNLAAPPGSSKHETGNAADVYIGGVALASHAQGKPIAQSLGLGWPVGGEPWHTEVVGRR